MPTPTARRARLATLTRANVDDLIEASGVPASFARLVALAAWPSARRFAGQLQRLDDAVASDGLVAGARAITDTFTSSLVVHDLDRVPPTGPLLALANHAGMVDAMSLVQALRMRPDLRIIALHREVLTAMPAVAQHLLWVDPHHGGRSALVRAACNHLRAGGALLTYPAGTIEPDPALRPGAAESVRRWSNSTTWFCRAVPEVQVLPMAVGGVISVRAVTSWLARRRATLADREWTAACLQVVLPVMRSTQTQVRVGTPLHQPSSDEVAQAMTALFARWQPALDRV